MNTQGIVIAIIIAGVVAVLATIFLVGSDPVVRSVVSTSTPTSTSAQNEEVRESVPVSVVPISHASAVLVWDTQTVYLDPVGEEELFADASEPDLILLTDIHGDHLSTSTLQALVSSSTVLVAPQAVADLLPAFVLERTTVLANGETAELLGFAIEAVPMYNLPESDDSRHVKGRGNGYVLERNETRVYVAGDTDDTQEMRALEDIDIAFIPMNPPFTMNVETAAEAVLAFAPKSVYPYHYRGQDGLSDVEQFRDLVQAGNANINVVLLDWYPQAQADQ